MEPITASMERAVERAYREHVWVASARREHLITEFSSGSCCRHSWQGVLLTGESSKFLREVFDEDDLGTRQLYCTRCGALSLWGPEGLWAYDNTRGFGQPPREHDQPRVTRPPRRGRRG